MTTREVKIIASRATEHVHIRTTNAVTSLLRKSCELQSSFDLGISSKRIPHETGAEVLSHQKSYSVSMPTTSVSYHSSSD